MTAPAWHARVALRGVVALVIGAIVCLGLVAWLGVAAALLAGWGVTALVAAGWSLLVIWPMDAAATRAHATAEDPGRRTSRVIVLLGSVASIAAVVVVLIQHRAAQGGMAFALAGIALASVAASWLAIQAAYVLRFADEFYSDPVGGIEFAEDPAYTDFVYVSFGVGLTYQVADTNLTTNRMRRIVIGQSLLGYLFGAVILGTVINLLAGL
ncbi:DUF1345 domain-containing protein [Microbacterium horticulturae]|uniref:DUF1345 domain-containing protein n=1 Tax=Microbacterium horticulturae TaxID=3028316 RepID=A0ABY8BTP8_9MICO|nr:DUF1345 domain-containing protein [Microbacterium sp. KACC 23027]WEG07549.1 DUF1345 domain-containing protein [Microbacterium sp. KACC 23027]